MAHISDIVERIKAQGMDTDEEKVALMLQRTGQTVEGWIAEDDLTNIQLAAFRNEPISKPSSEEAAALGEKYSFAPSLVKE